MKLRRILPSLALMAGSMAFLGSSVTAPAHAYTVSLNGRTAGNPAGQLLQDINLDSRYDNGRRLDPTVWYLSGGTSNDDGDTLSQDILGRAIITVLELSANKLSLKFDVENRTSSSFQAAIMGLWFGISPNITSASFSDDGTVFNSIEQPKRGNAPGGFKNIDVCIYAANNCEGGTINDGLQAGANDSFIIDLTGNFDTGNGYSTVTISDLGTKWQTQDGSYELAGVPEPMTMLGTGMAAGFGYLMKRKSAKRHGKSEAQVKA